MAPDQMLPAAATDIGIATVAWNGWVSEIKADDLRSGPITVMFDDELPVFGFHSAETDCAGTWCRWSGPTSHARIAMPLPAHGRWFLRFDILNWGVVQDKEVFRVLIRGQPVLLEQRAAGFVRFGPVDIPYHAATAVLCVDIVTPTPVRASVGDPRLIGVNFSHCRLERR